MVSFGFSFKKHNWCLVTYGFYQTSRCETDTNRADLVEVGGPGTQNSLTHGLCPLYPCALERGPGTQGSE